MKFIEIILSIFIKFIMIIWGLITLFLLSIVSLVVFIIFRLKFKLFKRKFKKFTNDLNLNNVFSSKCRTYKENSFKDKSNSSHTSVNDSIKTVKRKLETKDGEIN